MTTQIHWLPRPMKGGSQSVWSIAITMPTTPTIEPTERSMLRETMTSTIPVAMIPTEEVCTERFHRLRGVRNVPPDRKLKADPDHQEEQDHPHHSGVDLVVPQEGSN